MSTTPPPPPPGGMQPPPPPGGGMQPPPPPPGYGGVPGQAQTNNPLAIASLVVSLVSVICCGFGFITAIVGIVLGVVAKKQIAERGQKGEGMAQAGIIIGVVAIVISIAWWIFSIATGNSNFYYRF